MTHTIAGCTVGRVELLGGPFDGKRKVAVVGAPLVMKEKKKTANPYGVITFSFGAPPESESWKTDKAATPEPKYWLYVPVPGKMQVRYAGEFSGHFQPEAA